MITKEQVKSAIDLLKVGEGFEAGDLFPHLPSEETVYWQLTKVEDGVWRKMYTFKLYYRDVLLRQETLTISDKGELNYA